MKSQKNNKIEGGITDNLKPFLEIMGQRIDWPRSDKAAGSALLCGMAFLCLTNSTEHCF